MIKDGYKSELSGETIEKHVLVFTLAKLKELRICNNHECHNDSGNKFTDEDMQ